MLVSRRYSIVGRQMRRLKPSTLATTTDYDVRRRHRHSLYCNMFCDTYLYALPIVICSSLQAEEVATAATMTTATVTTTIMLLVIYYLYPQLL